MKLVGTNRKDWSKKLDGTFFSILKSCKTPISTTPFRLVYGKACHFQVELEYKAYWAIKAINFEMEQA